MGSQLLCMRLGRNALVEDPRDLRQCGLLGLQGALVAFAVKSADEGNDEGKVLGDVVGHLVQLIGELTACDMLGVPPVVVETQWVHDLEDSSSIGKHIVSKQENRLATASELPHIGDLHCQGGLGCKPAGSSMLRWPNGLPHEHDLSTLPTQVERAVAADRSSHGLLPAEPASRLLQEDVLEVSTIHGHARCLLDMFEQRHEVPPVGGCDSHVVFLSGKAEQQLGRYSDTPATTSTEPRGPERQGGSHTVADLHTNDAAEREQVCVVGVFVGRVILVQEWNAPKPTRAQLPVGTGDDARTRREGPVGGSHTSLNEPRPTIQGPQVCKTDRRLERQVHDLFFVKASQSPDLSGADAPGRLFRWGCGTQTTQDEHTSEYTHDPSLWPFTHGPGALYCKSAFPSSA